MGGFIFFMFLLVAIVFVVGYPSFRKPRNIIRNFASFTGSRLSSITNDGTSVNEINGKTYTIDIYSEFNAHDFGNIKLNEYLETKN